MISRLVLYLVTLPFPRVHCWHFHPRVIDTIHGKLSTVCYQCGTATPINLTVSRDEIRERKVR